MVPDYDGRGFLTYEGFCRQEREAREQGQNKMPRTEPQEQIAAARKEQMDRLRKRIRNAKAEGRDPELANCMLGILDLLADEA